MLRRMSTPQRYTEKVVLVTGAASGIGRATALRIAEEGGSVACLDMAVDGAEKTAAEIGGKGKAYACNVADEDSVASAVAAVVSDFGKLDVTCNIAGIGKFAHTTDASKDEWDRIIAVNLTGTFLMCRATIPHLLETGGNIVNTASTAGVIGQPYSAAYCASKGGVRLLTQALAWEYIDRGIRVNAVAPGGVQTPLIQNFGFPLVPAGGGRGHVRLPRIGRGPLHQRRPLHDRRRHDLLIPPVPPVPPGLSVVTSHV